MDSTGVETLMAYAILTMAIDGDMPDSYWLTDSRILLAATVLNINVADIRPWAEDMYEPWKEALGCQMGAHR